MVLGWNSEEGNLVVGEAHQDEFQDQGNNSLPKSEESESGPMVLKKSEMNLFWCKSYATYESYKFYELSQGS